MKAPRKYFEPLAIGAPRPLLHRRHPPTQQHPGALLDRDLLQRSVEILGELGLSKEKIVAYQRRFPIPTPTSGGPTAGVDNAMIQALGTLAGQRLIILPWQGKESPW
jgi:hypothetical protein